MLVIRSFSVKLPGGNSHRIMLSIAGTTLWFWWSLARFIASLRTEPGYTWCPPRGWCFVQVWCQDVSYMYSFWGWVTKTSQGISITTRMTPNFKTFVDLHCENYHWIDHQSYQNHPKSWQRSPFDEMSQNSASKATENAQWCTHTCAKRKNWRRITHPTDQWTTEYSKLTLFIPFGAFCWSSRTRSFTSCTVSITVATAGQRPYDTTVVEVSPTVEFLLHPRVPNSNNKR